MMVETKEPWVEKYRPVTLSDLAMSLEPMVVNKIMSLTNANVPHLMLFGDPGSSKTSAAIAIAKHLDADFVELNASDNRGINMISDLVNNFCRAVGPDDKIKIIILDEADNITKKAQQQLINFMENYPKVRVFFTCNDFDQMIEPLQSRCMLMRFPKPTPERSVDVMKMVLKKEGVKGNIGAIRRVVRESRGDLRVAINNLQAISVTNGSVDDAGVSAYFCQPSMQSVLQVVETAMKKGPNEAMAAYIELNRSGINGVDFMTVLRDLLQEDPTFPRRMAIMGHIHKCYYRMLNTMESMNQMAHFFYLIHSMV